MHPDDVGSRILQNIRLHSITFQKTETFTVTIVRTTNLRFCETLL